MPRYKLTFPQQQQRDPTQQASRQALNQSTIQRNQQTSAYAAAKFNEWQQNAPQREQELNLRVQNLQSEAELKGAQLNYNMWKDNELRRQTTAYYTAMPALQEQLKANGIFPGSQRYAAEMATFAAQIPDAVTHNDAIRKDLQDYSRVDATADQISQGVKTFDQAMQQANRTPGSIHVDKGGAITGEAGSGLPEKIVDRYARLQGAIELHQDLAAKQLKDDMAHNRTDMPYADQAKLNAAQKEASFLSNSYPKLSSMSQTPDSAPTAAPMTAPVPTATPDQTQAPAAPSQPNVPQSGQVVNGFTFKGGDPADQNNWEQTQ